MIPAFNEQGTIGDCLMSLSLQDYPGEVEIIVVDNGSTDATADIARAHGAVVLSEVEIGVCRARQRGSAAATGQIVVSTDADTTFPGSWLSQIGSTMTDRPELVATCGPCQFVGGPWWARPYTKALFGMTALIYRRTGRVVYASATNIAFRRSAWTGYDTSQTQGGDELGLLRSLRCRGGIHFDPERTTFTSARRLRRGLVYNTFVTCLFFYLFAYHVNRLAGRTVVGLAPAIRGDDRAYTIARRRRRSTFIAALTVVLALAWWLTPVDVV